MSAFFERCSFLHFLPADPSLLRSTIIVNNSFKLLYNFYFLLGSWRISPCLITFFFFFELMIVFPFYLFSCPCYYYYFNPQISASCLYLLSVKSNILVIPTISPSLRNLSLEPSDSLLHGLFALFTWSPFNIRLGISLDSPLWITHPCTSKFCHFLFSSLCLQVYAFKNTLWGHSYRPRFMFL